MPTTIPEALTGLSAALRAYERGEDETGIALLQGETAALCEAPAASLAEVEARVAVVELALAERLTPARLDAIRTRLRGY